MSSLSMLLNNGIISIEDDTEKFKKSIFELIQYVENESKNYGDSSTQAAAQHRSATSTNNKNNINTDLEFKIEADRILKILDCCIKKIEIAFCLSHIIKDEKKLIQYCPSTNERMQLIKLYKKYSKSINSLTVVNVNGITKFDSQLIDCINIAFECRLYEIVPDYIKKISLSGQQFITTLHEFYKLISNRILLTAPRCMAKEKILHKMWITNKKNLNKIEELQMKIFDEENRIKEIQNEKLTTINKHKDEMENLKANNYKTINDKIIQSTECMNNIYVESKTKQNLLTNEFNITKEKYDSLLKENLLHFKNKKEQKFKVQQKLQGWLNKYDTDVGEKSHELHCLKEKLKEDRSKFEEWKLEFMRQELEYNQIMEEKEAEDLRIRQEKLLLFMMNRAAKTIQLAWRHVLIRRKLKKKGKGKGKKGKK